MKNKIGIIGCGNMGRAIAQRLKTHYGIYVFDKDPSKIKSLKKINVKNNIIDLLQQAKVVILAVKPQGFETVLAEIKSHAKDKLIISIAAGIPTNYIQRRLGKVRVVRAMPNLPARIGKGMICISKGKFASKADLFFVKKIFEFMGTTMVIKENMMNAATAVSGSGPGYFYDLIEDKSPREIKEYSEDVFISNLQASAASAGFDPEQAKILATATTAGSIDLLATSALTTIELKKQVASKGGTTEAGLKVLHRGGSLIQAVKAALKRAKELSRR